MEILGKSFDYVRQKDFSLVKLFLLKRQLFFLIQILYSLKSPEILWEEFAFFNSDQLSGLSPSLYLYHRFYKFPVYGKSGLNAGVWMMNLTRIRSIPRRWTTAILKIASVYEGKLKLFDQDIANILFSKALFKAFLKFDVENPFGRTPPVDKNVLKEY
ncbi:Glucoside xylosyltransferase 2 [Armadillidium nasatum]|uniref:Glucoside xylosyltransferase 2 n=1 Tax=Armadillidium nasatum TaxID=96803 RepID=A0A5N5T1H3_9CRUS|nr:Glucoside xylosyltransferase 2 [Armadillidium nasatum]